MKNNVGTNFTFRGLGNKNIFICITRDTKYINCQHLFQHVYYVCVMGGSGGEGNAV